MAEPVNPLTPEERAQVLEIQDRLIELFLDRGEAVATGNQIRAETLRSEIDDLMRQRDAIKIWAAADGK